MFIEVLTVAQRSPERQWSEMTSHPGWPDVEEALLHLDGERSSLMTLGTGPRCMTIGGGRDGYLVYATLDAENYQHAVNPSSAAEPCEVRLNGTARACEARAVVSRLAALRAAHTFAVDGRLEPSLRWEAC